MVLVTKDYPAFVVNNIVVPMFLQAVRVLEMGLATKEEIDQAIKLVLGRDKGLLSLLDYIGLDIILDMAENLYAQTGDRTWSPPLLLKQMVTSGWLGRKSGRGFYEYPL